jgi:hypothetical protein
MPDPLICVRMLLARLSRRPTSSAAPGDACSWEAMRAVYQEQADRGDPDAVRGLELIEQGRWPSSGRPRGR